jgi:hypothetical protein
VTFEGLREFPGGYDEYLQHFGVDHLDREAVARAALETKRRAQSNAAELDTSSWEDQKKLRNRKKLLPKLRSDVEASISAAEERQKAIQASYASPGFFETASPAELDRLKAEERTLATQIDSLMAQWEALEEESLQLENV